MIGFKPVVVHLWIENWMAFLWVRREGGVITSVENSNEKKPSVDDNFFTRNEPAMVRESEGEVISDVQPWCVEVQ